MKANQLTRLLLTPLAGGVVLSVAAGCGDKSGDTGLSSTPRTQYATPSSAQGGARGAAAGARGGPVGAYAGGPPEAEKYRSLVDPNAKPPGAR